MVNLKSPSVRIAALITIFPLISLFLYGALSHIFFVDAQRSVVEQDIKNTKTAILEIEQQNLKEKVNIFTRAIKYHNAKNIERSKDNTKEVVYFAADIINNLYHKNYHSIDEKTLKKMMISALEELSFGKHIDYIFLQNLNGNALVHRDDGLVNTNTLSIKDVNEKLIIKEFTQVINDHGEGFARYYWYKTPNNKTDLYSKLTFVKKLDAYNWYIGAGKKVENVVKATREDILDYLTDNATFKDGYFFITDSKNKILLPPNNHDSEHLKQFRIEGFFKDEHHLAYTGYIAHYDWYVTAVKELSAIRKNIATKKSIHENAINNETKKDLVLMILSWLISLLLSLYLSSLVYRKLKAYKSELDSTNNKLIFQSRQATIGELLPMIAHQWRQPINKIASTLAVIRFNLLQKDINPKQLDQQCYSVEQDIEFMSETIDDFRTFYKPRESQALEDLKALIYKSLGFLNSAIRKKNIDVHLNLTDISFELYGNEFMQVAINLIDNAVEAAPSENGIIKIDLYNTTEGKVFFSVEDNGTGIDDQSIIKVFDPYYSTKKGSMGLGLYMCKMIVEKHLKGQIVAEKLTAGTRFVVTLSL